jgi:hypothetical protein
LVDLDGLTYFPDKKVFGVNRTYRKIRIHDGGHRIMRASLKVKGSLPPNGFRKSSDVCFRKQRSIVSPNRVQESKIDNTRQAGAQLEAAVAAG